MLAGANLVASSASRLSARMPVSVYPVPVVAARPWTQPSFQEVAPWGMLVCNVSAAFVLVGVYQVRNFGVICVPTRATLGHSCTGSCFDVNSTWCMVAARQRTPAFVFRTSAKVVVHARVCTASTLFVSQVDVKAAVSGDTSTLSTSQTLRPAVSQEQRQASTCKHQELGPCCCQHFAHHAVFARHRHRPP